MEIFSLGHICVTGGIVVREFSLPPPLADAVTHSSHGWSQNSPSAALAVLLSTLLESHLCVGLQILLFQY